MNSLPLADARILAPVVAFLDNNGARAESYLDHARIPGELIEEGGMVAKKQIHDLLLGVARIEGCEAVGFAAYLDLQLNDLGPMGTAMKDAKTAREGLEIFSLLASRAYEGNQYFLKSEGDTTWLCFRDDDYESPGYIYSHYVTMMAYRQMVRILVGDAWRPRQMRCHGPELNAHRHVEGFEDCTASFHADESALAVPTELLSRPVLVGENTGATDVESYPIPDEPNGPGTFSDSLQCLIASRFLYRTLPTLEQMAMIIDVSPRTIQRCLLNDGLTYRRLLDRVCIDAAREMLSTSRLTISEIALELGVLRPNSFVRGFRRMTGMTPGHYRRRRLGQ